MEASRDLQLARAIAEDVARLGGRAYFVGGVVRDGLMGVAGKDIDVEVYGISPRALRGALAARGKVVEKGASFGVLGLEHTNLDIAMPAASAAPASGIRTSTSRSTRRSLPREASMRRDFTINAMMRDVLTGELVDCWNGRADLAARVIRRVSAKTFPEDALRVFRAAQFAARLNAKIEPETAALCAESTCFRFRASACSTRCARRCSRPSARRSFSARSRI